VDERLVTGWILSKLEQSGYNQGALAEVLLGGQLQHAVEHRVDLLNILGSLFGGLHLLEVVFGHRLADLGFVSSLAEVAGELDKLINGQRLLEGESAGSVAEDLLKLEGQLLKLSKRHKPNFVEEGNLEEVFQALVVLLQQEGEEVAEDVRFGELDAVVDLEMREPGRFLQSALGNQIILHRVEPLEVLHPPLLMSGLHLFAHHASLRGRRVNWLRVVQVLVPPSCWTGRGQRLLQTQTAFEHGLGVFNGGRFLQRGVESHSTL